MFIARISPHLTYLSQLTLFYPKLNGCEATKFAVTVTTQNAVGGAEMSDIKRLK